MSSWIESMYSCDSPTGLVSSKRRWQRPPNSWAIPKLSAIALEWPRWRYPFGSGGKRVTTAETLPSRTSAATVSWMKSRRSGEAGLRALTSLLLVTPNSVVQYVAIPTAHRPQGTQHPERIGYLVQTPLGHFPMYRINSGLASASTRLAAGS